MPTYLIPVTCDLGATFPSVGQVIQEVNNNMASFGFSEKMLVRSQLCEMKLTTSRELTEEEKTDFYLEIATEYQRKLPDIGIEVARPQDWKKT